MNRFNTWLHQARQGLAVPGATLNLSNRDLIKNYLVTERRLLLRIGGGLLAISLVLALLLLPLGWLGAG
jgi:hypothetical protein